MNLREPEKQILDDFEHKVTNKMQKYGDEPDFPKLDHIIFVLENFKYSRH